MTNGRNLSSPRLWPERLIEHMRQLLALVGLGHQPAERVLDHPAIDRRRDAVALGGGDEVVRRDDACRSRRACAAAARSARRARRAAAAGSSCGYSSKRPSSSAALMRAAHCISRRRRISSMSFSAKLWTRLRPAFLRGRAGAVGGREHRRDVLVVGGDRHHADARAEAEHAVFPGEAEVAHRLAQRLGGAHRLIQRAALEQDAELVAAEARRACRASAPWTSAARRPGRAARRRRCGRRCR